MKLMLAWASALNILLVAAQTTGESITLVGGTNTPLVSGSVSSSTSTGAGNATYTGPRQVTVTRSSQTLIEIDGQTSPASNSLNGTATTTSSSATPVNTAPCNNYPEFCNRKYSNITEVCSHNSAFSVPRSLASNQELDIVAQLDDGVRMIQGQTLRVNNTIYSCHSSCDLLNAGLFEDLLNVIADWVASHPFDVVTILIGNSNFADGVTVLDYVEPIQNSRIARFLYEPEFVPQRRDQWPTLGEMILSGQRVVMFMDYDANQTAVPYVLDQFAHMWETPFSPQDPAFPCTQDRPPNLDPDAARDDFMYMANHNLNVAVDISAILGIDGEINFLVPDVSQVNRTNGALDEFGMLGAMANNCTRLWGRPPNFLLVDYYNRGYPEAGSVFEVAARANNVTYNRPCCGEAASAAVRRSEQNLVVALAAAFVSAVYLLAP